MLYGMLYGVLYGDLLMTLVNQVRPYEVEKGAAQRLADEWTTRLGRELGQGHIRYQKVKENYRRIIDGFAGIPVEKRDAVNSGKYDKDKIALIYFQTGGGCRASNYMSLIRKALKRAGCENIPVISFSFAGIEKHPGF